MEDFRPSTYGDRIAAMYDDWYAHLEVDAVVDRLAEMAGRGPALELGIGTGRIALPLSERLIEVHGIDASEAMLAGLRRKPGADRINVTVGDFAEVDVDGKYRLIYVVFNTIFALVTQEDQIRCFHNVAERLTDDGVFVFDAFVPDLGRFDRNGRVGIEAHEPDAIRLEASLHDPVNQSVMSRHILLSEKGVTLYPLKIRYAWPSELDLMARLAGLQLRERWGGWHGERFSASSTMHVSVYERASR